ncbi:MAG TPA: ChaN family lipoprotein, partial [Polyangiales bacterium]
MRTSRALSCCCLLVAWLAGCACATHHPHATAPKRLERSWETKLDRDHPLVGEIWDVTRKQRIDLETLRARLQDSELVLLGESHDNADHHRLEAELLEAVLAKGRKPTVVFEMLELGKQATIDRALAEHPQDVDGLGAAVDWSSSGWPSWSLYRPVFASAIGARLPLAAAGLDRPTAMHIAREGLAALDPGLVAKFALDTALPALEQAQMRAEMKQSHCGLLPNSILDSMVLVQRARDAQLAERLHARSVPGQGAVLIAGTGHVRNDRGVPAAL